MKILKKTALLLLVLLGGASCGGSSPETNSHSSKKQIEIHGSVEKGPFLSGSSVTIDVLSEDGGNTSSTITTSTTDNLGSFKFSAETDKLLLLTSKGHYRNEITGGLSTTTLTLKSIYKTTTLPNQYANVNILTHFTSNRIIQLISSSDLSYEEAARQAEFEFLSTFENVIAIPESLNFTSFSIYESQTSSGNAYLLAISSMIYQYAIELSQENGTNSDNELAKLLNKMEEDFTKNGIIDDKTILEDLKKTHTKINPDKVINNVKIWINGTEGYSAPDINKYLDSDLDGLSNIEDLDDDNDGIKDDEDSSPYFSEFNINNQNIITNENTFVDIDISSNYSLGETTVMTVIEYPKHGSLIGSYPDIQYIPNSDYKGIDNFSYILSHKNITSNEANINISIFPTDNTPVISGLPSSTILVGSEYSFTPTVFNIKSDTIKFAIDNKPDWADFNNSTGTLSGTPTNDNAGQYSDIVIHVFDGSLSSSLTSFSIKVIANPWEVLPNMSTGRHSPTAVVVNDSIFVIGGFNNGSLKNIEAFNIATNSWESKPNMLVARYNHTSNVVDGKIYIIGGTSNQNSVESYNIESESWSIESPMDTPRSIHTSCVYEDTIYVFGGSNNDNSLSSVEAYDTLTHTWSYKAPNSKLGWGSSCVTLNGQIFVFGGSNNENGYEVYDPNTDTWVKSGSLNSPKRYGFSAEVVGQTIYLTGGYKCSGGCSSLSTVEALNINDYSWSIKTPMLQERNDIASSTIGDTIYIIGGRNHSSNNLSVFEKYDTSID